MNTGIKTTLFSFVTMRAPGLTEDKSKQNNFVFRDSDLSGPYDTVAIANPNGGKLEAMKPVVPNPLLESEKAVFELNHGLYDFSVWIARNRSDFDKEEFSKMKALQVH